MPPHPAPPHILVVEDNEADIRLVQEALHEHAIPHVLHVARNGDDAVAFVRRLGRFADAPRPALILLDLNLPRRNGREVLAELKRDPQLAAIPVVVLTSSRADADVAACYALHANCYVVKPVAFDRFVAIMGTLGEFWFRLVRLPQGEPHADARA